MAGVAVCMKNKNVVNDHGRYHFGIQWEADEFGIVPETDLPEIDGYVSRVVTKPGDPAPKAGYGIVLQDPCGMDIMSGGLSSLSADTDEHFSPNVSGNKSPVMVQGILKFILTGNTVAGAKGNCIIYIQE
jgi:hypothetical protein